MISKGGLGDSGSEKVRGTGHSSGHWRGYVLRSASLLFFGLLFVFC